MGVLGRPSSYCFLVLEVLLLLILSAASFSRARSPIT
jgi:hypothetical protein